MVKTPPFHGDNMGSNPVGVIKKTSSQQRACFFVHCGHEKPWRFSNLAKEAMNLQFVQCSNLVRAWAPEHSEEVPSGHSNPVGVIKGAASLI